MISLNHFLGAPQASFKIIAFLCMHCVPVIVKLVVPVFVCFFQNLYGRMGRKPNLPLIQAYEYFTFENFKKLKLNRMLKVIVSRCIFLKPFRAVFT